MLKVKRWEKIHYVHTNYEKSGIAISIPDKVDSKEEYYKK